MNSTNVIINTYAWYDKQRKRFRENIMTDTITHITHKIRTNEINNLDSISVDDFI